MNELNQFGAQSLNTPQLQFGSHTQMVTQPTTEALINKKTTLIATMLKLHFMMVSTSPFANSIPTSLLFSLRPGEANGTSKAINIKGVVEYNITCLKQAISQLFNLNIHGIQARPSLNMGLGGAGIGSSEYGIHHYMGSYASQSAMPT
jgi:hypothetical protein